MNALKGRPLICAALFAAVVMIGANAEALPSVAYAGTDCSQFVTNIEVSATNVRPYVPDAFIFSRDAIGKAAIGYRVYACREMRLNGSEPFPVVWSEIGVRIRNPEGLEIPDHVDPHVVDGHDYYMLSMHAASALLSSSFSAAGSPATYVEQMSYEWRAMDLGATLNASEFVPGEGAYEVSVSDSPAPSIPAPDFDIRGWHEGGAGLLRYTEHRMDVLGRFPKQIAIHADPGTLLARPLGKTDVTVFDTVVTFDVDGATVTRPT